MRTTDDPGRLARDAYTYGHLPIVAGIIATAVGLKLLIAAPDRALPPVGLAMVFGGPVLYLLGESHYRWLISRTHNVKGLAVASVLLLLAPTAHSVGARSAAPAPTGVDTSHVDMARYLPGCRPAFVSSTRA